MTRACLTLALTVPLATLLATSLGLGCNTPSNQPKPRVRSNAAKTPEALEASRKAAAVRRERDRRIEALCQQPAQRTASPDEACERMVTAHARQLDKGKATPPTEASATARRNLLTSTCVERPIAVVLCQAHVLETITADDENLLTDALNRCSEKFADA